MKRSRIVVVALSLCLALALTILGLAFVNSDGRRDEPFASSPSRSQTATKIDTSDSESKGDLSTVKAVEKLQLILVLRDPGLDRSFDREFALSLNLGTQLHRNKLERPCPMALRLELRQLAPETSSMKHLTLHSLDLGSIEVRDTEDQQLEVAISASKRDALRQVLEDHLD